MGLDCRHVADELFAAIGCDLAIRYRDGSRCTHAAAPPAAVRDPLVPERGRLKGPIGGGESRYLEN